MGPTRGAGDQSEVTALQAYAGVIANLLGAAAKAEVKGALADQLQVALDSRAVIEWAKGALMERERLDDQEALTHLRRAARSSWASTTPTSSPRRSPRSPRCARRRAGMPPSPTTSSSPCRPAATPPPYAAVGATWWLVELPWVPVSVDQVRGVIRDGTATPRPPSPG
jgi:ANTAR domain